VLRRSGMGVMGRLGPRLVRAAGSLGHLLARGGIHPGRLSAPAVLDAARRRTGLEDMGDPPHEEPLKVLTRSLDADAGLSLVGRLVARGQLVDYAAQRLGIQAAFTAIPQLAEQEVKRPLFIVGLPRSGTTLLHNLLAGAPDARAPRTWELLCPAPPCQPGSREQAHRIRTTRRAMRGLRFLAPDLQVIHPIGARDIEECYPLLNQTFVSPALVLHYGIPGYARWLEEVPHSTETQVYRAYRRGLQLLQFGHPAGRWVLKSAVHLYYLRALLEVFPDAAIVWTHRDPRQLIPSACSMVAAFRRLVVDHLDERVLGPWLLQQFRRLVRRGRQARSSAPDRVLDIDYPDLVRDPLGVVRGIHRHLGLPWHAEQDARVAAWLAANPQHKHGVHRYTLPEFGLTESAVRELE